MPTQTLNQDVFDALLKQSLDVLRVSASKQNIEAAKLDQLAKQIRIELDSDAITSGKVAKLNKALKSIEKLIEAQYQNIADSQSDTTDALVKAQYKATTKALEEIYGSELVSTVLPKDFPNVLVEGLPISKWWEAQANDLAFKAQQQIRSGVVNGETISQITARIVGDQTQAGVIDIAKNHVRTLVHTSVQAANNVGRNAGFQNNSDVIKGIEQVSTLDSHTSLICVSYSGARWNLEYEPIDGNDLPYNNGVPRHFNCRSVEIPITKTFKELGIDIDEPKLTTRSSELGQISAKTTFNDFLNRIGEEEQNVILGVGRADLWRAGKITLRDLVNGQGSPLTLEELLAKHGS